jgi:multidrug efflux pump subunit AcrB
MGTGVVGGMLAATFIATIFIPVFFVLVARRRKARHTVEAAPAE